MAAPGGVAPVIDNGGLREKGQSYNSNVRLPFGNAASYRVAKLKRDHPAIADRLAAGEFKSVAAAERAAKGEPQPLDHLKHWWRKATDPERIREAAEEVGPGQGRGPTLDIMTTSGSPRSVRDWPRAGGSDRFGTS